MFCPNGHYHELLACPHCLQVQMTKQMTDFLMASAASCEVIKGIHITLDRTVWIPFLQRLYSGAFPENVILPTLCGFGIVRMVSPTQLYYSATTSHCRECENILAQLRKRRTNDLP